MKPRLPRGLDPGKPVIAQDVGTYVTKLEEFYKDAYTEIQRLLLETAENNEGDGNTSAELFVGDLVLLKKEPTNKREGPLRFQPRTYPEIYRIRK